MAAGGLPSPGSIDAQRALMEKKKDEAQKQKEQAEKGHKQLGEAIEKIGIQIKDFIVQRLSLFTKLSELNKYPDGNPQVEQAKAQIKAKIDQLKDAIDNLIRQREQYKIQKEKLSSFKTNISKGLTAMSGRILQLKAFSQRLQEAQRARSNNRESGATE